MFAICLERHAASNELKSETRRKPCDVLPWLRCWSQKQCKLLLKIPAILTGEVQLGEETETVTNSILISALGWWWTGRAIQEKKNTTTAIIKKGDFRQDALKCCSVTTVSVLGISNMNVSPMPHVRFVQSHTPPTHVKEDSENQWNALTTVAVILHYQEDIWPAPNQINEPNKK